jgi:hypothetical protein
MMPLKCPIYGRVNMADILKEIINEYKLREKVYDG